MLYRKSFYKKSIVGISAFILSISTLAAGSSAIPGSWSNLLGDEHISSSYYAGIAETRTAQGSFPVVFQVDDEFKKLTTLENPVNPHMFQCYELTDEGLRYVLRFREGVIQEGTLNQFAEDDSCDDEMKTWIFKNDLGITHKIGYSKERRILFMETSFRGGRLHARLELNKKDDLRSLGMWHQELALSKK